MTVVTVGTFCPDFDHQNVNAKFELLSLVFLDFFHLLRSATSYSGASLLLLKQSIPFDLLTLADYYFAVKICILLFSLFPWHGVSWLYGRFQVSHIEDKGDVWKKTWGRQVRMIHEGGHPNPKQPHSLPGFSPVVNTAVDVLSLICFFSTYLFGMGIHVFCLLVMPKVKAF